MENSEVRDNQPTAETPWPEEPVQQIMRSDNNNGALTQEPSVYQKVHRFIAKALASLEELKTECGEDEEKKSIYDSFGLCLEDYYSLQGIEVHMLATHLVSAEKVGVLYKELVERTGGNACGFEDYEEQCARLRRENEALEEGSIVSGSGDMAQPHKLSVKEEADCFIGKVLSLLEELKTECRNNDKKRSIHDSFGLCLEDYFTLQEIEAHMLTTHGVSAEKVGVLYKELVERTGGSASGVEAYEEHSIECARLRREKEAETFIGKVLWVLVDLKKQCGEDDLMRKIHDNIGMCVSRCYTSQEMEAHMSATCGLSAEHVRAIYDGIVVGTGDASGGEAYEKHSMDCARLRREKEAEEAKKERILDVYRVSTSGRE